MPKNSLMGVSGLAGSFSEQAALRYIEQQNLNASLVYLVDMEGVLAAVEDSSVHLGIFPVINTIGGLVKPAFAAMGKHLFDPIDELWLEVNQCLLALPNTDKSQITQIVSHSQALAQCKNYLTQNFPQAELVEWIDTAKAAQDLAKGEFSTTTAVIAPESSAPLYTLNVLAKNIQDKTPNLTAFIIAKKANHKE